MNKLIDLPDGNALSPVVIKGVHHVPGRGVLIRDAQLRIVAWIMVADDEKARRVRDLMKAVVNDGYRAKQPDWSFLESEVKE
jgi:hypothetical protein